MNENEKRIKTRIQHKYDTAENWAKAINFVPLKGELIIYDFGEERKVKIGDGETLVNDLDFKVLPKLKSTASKTIFPC